MTRIIDAATDTTIRTATADELSAYAAAVVSLLVGREAGIVAGAEVAEDLAGRDVYLTGREVAGAIREADVARHGEV